MDSVLNVTVGRILTTAAKRKSSNIHFTVGAYPTLRIDEDLLELQEEQVITESFMTKLIEGLLDDSEKQQLEKDREIIVVKEFGGKFRFKVSIFSQKKYFSASLKIISDRVPPLINLGLPKTVYSLTDSKDGLIIVTGPYGSGRTTTVAAIIEEINRNRKENIVTIEKPVEYVFTNQKSLVEQRGVGVDVANFTKAIQYFEEADVDVMSVAVNNESGVIPLVLEFAASGRLAIFQMDTTSVIQTIEEVIASFGQDQNEKARLLLSRSLLAIVCQRLVPRVGGGLVLASEVLIVNEAVRSLIKEGRIKQIVTILQSSRTEGMSTLDQSLADLVKSGDVLIDKAVEHSSDPSAVRAMIKN